MAPNEKSWTRAWSTTSYCWFNKFAIWHERKTELVDGKQTFKLNGRKCCDPVSTFKRHARLLTVKIDDCKGGTDVDGRLPFWCACFTNKPLSSLNNSSCKEIRRLHWRGSCWKCPDRYTTSSTKKTGSFISKFNASHFFRKHLLEFPVQWLQNCRQNVRLKGDYDALDNLETLTVTRLIDAGIATYLASFRAALVSL